MSSTIDIVVFMVIFEVLNFNNASSSVFLIIHSRKVSSNRQQNHLVLDTPAYRMRPSKSAGWSVCHSDAVGGELCTGLFVASALGDTK